MASSPFCHGKPEIIMSKDSVAFLVMATSSEVPPKVAANLDAALSLLSHCTVLEIPRSFIVDFTDMVDVIFKRLCGDKAVIAVFKIDVIGFEFVSLSDFHPKISSAASSVAGFFVDFQTFRKALNDADEAIPERARFFRSSFVHDLMI